MNFLITTVLEENEEQIPCVFAKIKKNLGLFRFNSKILKFTEIPNYQNTKLSDIAIATSAAKPVFPAKKIRENTFIDGGFTNNDPTLIGYLFALEDPKLSQMQKKIHIFLLACSLKEDPIKESARFFFRYLRNFESRNQENRKRIEDNLPNMLGQRYRRIKPADFGSEIDLYSVSRFHLMQMMSAASIKKIV